MNYTFRLSFLKHKKRQDIGLITWILAHLNYNILIFYFRSKKDPSINRSQNWKCLTNPATIFSSQLIFLVFYVLHFFNLSRNHTKNIHDTLDETRKWHSWQRQFKVLCHYQRKYLILIHTNSQWLNQAKRGDKCKSSHLNMLISSHLNYFYTKVTLGFRI